MNPKIISINKKMVVGMQSKMRHGEYGNIVKLWKSFMPFRKHIKNAVNQDLIAMQIYEDLNIPQNSFEIWACAEVLSLDDIPENMSSCSISQGEYAVFIQKGMDASATYQRIITEWLPDSGYEIDDRPHFQVMGEKYKNGSPDSEEDFYVPIRSLSL